MVMDGNTVKVVAWYDNEWAYSKRVVELTRLLHRLKSPARGKQPARSR